jgi:hypothetical protein
MKKYIPLILTISALATSPLSVDARTPFMIQGKDLCEEVGTASVLSPKFLHDPVVIRTNGNAATLCNLELALEDPQRLIGYNLFDVNWDGIVDEGDDYNQDNIVSEEDRKKFSEGLPSLVSSSVCNKRYENGGYCIADFRDFLNDLDGGRGYSGDLTKIIDYSKDDILSISEAFGVRLYNEKGEQFLKGPKSDNSSLESGLYSATSVGYSHYYKSILFDKLNKFDLDGNGLFDDDVNGDNMLTSEDLVVPTQ